jgi:hypothetical protein
MAIISGFLIYQRRRGCDMSRNVLFLIGSGWFISGIYIFVEPLAFYNAVPGLALLGPFSVHFVRDVGLAFIASGALTVWGAWRRQRELAVAGTFWAVLHALFHLHVWGHRGFLIDWILAFDLAVVIGPSFLALACTVKLGGAEESVRS